MTDRTVTKTVELDDGCVFTGVFDPVTGHRLYGVKTYPMVPNILVIT